MDQYKALGATVIGVSNDEIDTLHKFSLTECGGKFPVAADPDQKIIKAYDAKMPLLNYATRVSYVITPDDKILYEYSALAPSQHVAKPQIGRPSCRERVCQSVYISVDHASSK